MRESARHRGSRADRMLYRSWPFGARRPTKCIAAEPSTCGKVLILEDAADKAEAYVLVGDEHSDGVKVGDEVLIEFVADGPFGGRWATVPPVEVIVHA